MDRRKFIKFSISTLAISTSIPSALAFESLEPSFSYEMYREIWFKNESTPPETYLAEKGAFELPQLLELVKRDYKTGAVVDVEGFHISKGEIAYFATLKQ